MNLRNKLKRYLMEPPLPDFLIQISPNRISGLRVKSREGQGVKYFIFPLESGLIEPSAEKNNIREPEKLIKIIQQGLKQLGGSKGGLSLLLPESCFRLFVLTTESLPATKKEKIALIKWRIKKLYPILPDDFRFDFQTWRFNSSFRMLVVGARASVIEEYEKLLAKAGWPVKIISVPTIYLLPLVEEASFLVANVEKDYLAVLAEADHSPVLYRVKSFRLEKEKAGDFSYQCLAEIENSLHFIEDKEKRQLKMVFLRWAVGSEPANYLINSLHNLSLEVFRFEASRLPGIKEEDSEVLAPLLGQLISYKK